KAQPSIVDGTLRLRPLQRGVEAAPGHLEASAQHGHRIVGLLRADEVEFQLLSFAKKAAAFFKISRSTFSRSFSRRSRWSSSRSVSVLRPSGSSCCARLTH